MTKKRVAIIGTNGIPAKYGGFETLSEYLARGLNVEYDLYCYCSKSMHKERHNVYKNTKLIYLPFRANGWQSIIYDVVSVIYSLFRHDILLCLGYSGALVFPLKFFCKKNIILNIGGFESKKVRDKKPGAKIEIVLKKIFEYISVKSSDNIIVDNQAIYDYIVSKYKFTPYLIEYGGDHAEHESLSYALDKYPFLNTDYDITISRAQEDMNIHMVIEAYKFVLDRNIVIISNWEISEYGRKLKSINKDKYRNIFLVDAIYDLKILNAIRSNANIYLHTHSLCGTAPSLVEAMSLKLPVICFDVPANRSSTEEKSYYFKTVNSLISILTNLNILKMDKLRHDMYEIAYRRYTWSRIVHLYKEVMDLYAKY
jgi:glycosyltransferase involved in cell wall biosynthesis